MTVAVQKASRAPIDELPDLMCACGAARRAARALTQLYDSQLRSSGVEVSQLGLLSILDSRPGSSQAAVGRMFGMDKTTLSRNFKLLKRKGWVEPATGKDERERGFRLTPAGRERLRAARPLWKKAQEQLRSAMSAGEWETMWKVLRVTTQAAYKARQDRVPA
jgi:DNA-binding MarR family transcriptional regulator